MERRVTLEVKEKGLRAVLTATRPDDGRGLYKAWVLGPTGRMLLGTMAPESGGLSIRRSISLAELNRCGAWPALGAEAELAFSFGAGGLPPGWRAAEGAELHFADGSLGAQVRALSGAMLYTDRGGFFLAAPWSPRRPFPLAGLFCFADLKALGEETWAVFCFDPEGNPCVPHNGGRGERY